MVVGVIMIPVLYFAGAGSTVFWIIGTYTYIHINVHVNSITHNFGIIEAFNTFMSVYN